MATLTFGVPAADLQTVLTTLADDDPELLLRLLGLDMDGAGEILDDDPDCFEALLKERLGLLLAGHQTWTPTPDDVP